MVCCHSDQLLCSISVTSDMDLVEPQSLHFHRHFSPECGMSSKSGDTLGVISDWTLVSTLVPADSHLQIGQTMAENAQTFLFTSTLLQTIVAICKTLEAIFGDAMRLKVLSITQLHVFDTIFM